MKQNKTIDDEHWSLGSDNENESIEQPTIKKGGGVGDSSSIGSDDSSGRGVSVHSPLRVLLRYRLCYNLVWLQSGLCILSA